MGFASDYQAEEQAAQQAAAKAAPAPVPAPASPGATPRPDPTTTGNGAPGPSTPGGQPGGWGWGTWRGGPTFPGSQPLNDWLTAASSDFPIDAAAARAVGQPLDVVRLRAEADAARQRLGARGAFTADVAGTLINPTNAATAIPYAGPGVASAASGALQDYASGADPATIGRNAAGNALIGEATLAGSKVLTPDVMRQVGERIVDLGVPGLAGLLFGHGTGSPEAGFGGAYFLHAAAEKMGLPEKLGEWFNKGAKGFNRYVPPWVQQQGLYGTEAALRQQSGVDWNSWIPGQ